MKKPRSNSDLHWEKLVRSARADVGPSTDSATLLRLVRQAPLASNEGWFDEFSALFASGKLTTACLAGSCMIALVTAWQVWDVWEALPWAELLTNATGGTL
jgi:hypothetical protein